MSKSMHTFRAKPFFFPVAVFADFGHIHALSEASLLKLGAPYSSLKFVRRWLTSC